MDTILIVGVDSIVGANLAAVLSETVAVCGVPRSIDAGSVAPIGGCEILADSGQGERHPRQLIGRASARRVVFCGPGAESSWHCSPRTALGDDAVSSVRRWAAGAQAADAEFTCISSDAVFTGPWMFHPESSRGLCGSRQAHCLRDMESAVLEEHVRALVVRTHVFGWMPACCGAGWIERELSALESGTSPAHDPFRHATPMLATDFAEVLQHAWREGLAGVYHIAGAERANPARFVQRLAQEFDLPLPATSRPESLIERPQGFGCGEASLRTAAIRRALGISLPSLSDGLRRLREQQDNGFRDRLNGSAAPPRQNQAA